MSKPAGLISAFLDARAAEQGAAENTLLGYGRDLGDFADWCGRKGIAFDAVERQNIEEFVIDCEAQGLAQSTRARKLSSLKQFFCFLFEEGLRADNPAIEIKGPGRSKRLPKTLTLDEVERLLQASREVGRGTAKLRNTCLMEILYATGMRVSELVSLPLSAAKGDPQILYVLGKGGKERMVPLSEPARDAMRIWLSQRLKTEEDAVRDGRPQSRFLFPSRGKSGHLSRHGFYTLLRDISVAAGVSPSKVSPHTLRHAFATHLLAGGADLRAIQLMLGHEDVATTEIYTHVLDERLAELVNQHHPLARDTSGSEDL